MFVFFKKFFIPIYPNPIPFHFSPRAWLQTWELLSIIMIILSGLFLLYYYFFTKPDTKGTMRFFGIIILNIAISMIVSLLYILNKASSMIRGEDVILDKFGLIIPILLSSFMSTFIFLVSIYIILMIIAYIFKPKCRLRAMRRYPFSFDEK